MKITDLMKLAAVSATSASIFAAPAQAQSNQAEQGPMNPAVAQGMAAGMAARAAQLARQAAQPQQMQPQDPKDIEQAYVDRELVPSLNQIKNEIRGFKFLVRQDMSGDDLIIRTNLAVCDANTGRLSPLNILLSPQPLAATNGTSATNITMPAIGANQVLYTVAKLAVEQLGPGAQRPDPRTPCAPPAFKK